MKKISILILLICFMACSFGANAFATLTGSLSVGDGLDISTSDKWQNAEFSWKVTYNQNEHWNYSYTWNAHDTDAKALSHIVVEVSNTFSKGNLINSSPLPSDLGFDPTADKFGPGEIYGLKWDLGPSDDTQKFTFSFNSDRAPMWGDIFAKDGKYKGNNMLFATNSGYGTDLPGSGLSDLTYSGGGYALVPNTHSSAAPVPEPGTMFLFGTGLLGLIGIGRRKFTSKA